VILLIILTLSQMMTFSLLFARVNALAYLILSLTLYLIHTCLSHFMLYFFCGLIVCVRSPIYPRMECHEGKNISRRTERNPGSCYSSTWKEARWISVCVHYELNPDRSLAHLKVCLVAKGYCQMYKMDYQDTFSPIAKLTSARIFFFGCIHHWPLHGLDVKNYSFPEKAYA